MIVVGGGAKLCGDHLAGASAVLHPPYATVANAVGAAIPQVVPHPILRLLSSKPPFTRLSGLCVCNPGQDLGLLPQSFV